MNGRFSITTAAGFLSSTVFHYTVWLLGILIIASHNPYSGRLIYNLLYKITKHGLDSRIIAELGSTKGANVSHEPAWEDNMGGQTTISNQTGKSSVVLP